MNKISLVFLLVILFFGCNNESIDINEPPCDNGTFVGDVLLRTQQEVEDFGALCYSKIEGNLIIGIDGGESDVNDLTSLNALGEVTHWLTIFTKEITSLNGLHNISSAGGLSLRFCNGLTDLSGLEGLTKLNGGVSSNFGAFGLRVLYNSNLEHLSGLNNLLSIDGFVEIVGNSSLVNLTGLQNLEKIEGSSGANLLFAANPMLENIDALNSLIKVDGLLNTSIACIPGGTLSCGNDRLSDFCGLQNLFQNGIYIEGNISIDNNAYNPTIQDIIDGNCSQ